MPTWGETPNHSRPSLCRTCQNVMIIKGDRINNETIICHVHPAIRVTFDVRSCDGYQQKTTQSIHEMREVAWVIEVNKRSGKVGFRPPKKQEDD